MMFEERLRSAFALRLGQRSTLELGQRELSITVAKDV